MLKVNRDALSVDSGKFYYEGKLFTGVGFEVTDCTVNRAVKYKDGDAENTYINEHLSTTKHRPAIIFDCLEPEDEMEEEPLCYKGTRFSGLAYDFDGDLCVGELLFESGWQGSAMTYYKSGFFDSIEIINDDCAQKYYWYELGQIKRLDLYERNSFDVNLNFNEDGLISTISIDGRYFDRIKEVREELMFCLYDHTGFTKNLSASDYLYLSGSSIDSELFSNLLKSDGLKNTTTLRIFSTPLTIENLEKLIPINNIIELDVESEVITLEEMQKLKSKKPNCLIGFNRKEVTI